MERREPMTEQEIIIKCPKCKGMDSQEIKVEVANQGTWLGCKCSCGESWLHKLVHITREPMKVYHTLQENEPGNDIVNIQVTRWNPEIKKTMFLGIKLKEDMLEPTDEGRPGKYIEVTDTEVKQCQ